MLKKRDTELIRETLRGDHQAFAEIVRRYQRRVELTIRGVIGRIDDDELADLVQEVFLLLFRSLSSFRGESQLGTYLTTIAMRHSWRAGKRRRRRDEVEQPSGDPREFDLKSEHWGSREWEPDRDLLRQERHQQVNRALEQLPEEFRIVLVLRVVEEMPVEQVAAILGVSEGTVKSRTSRAREKMRALLEQSVDPLGNDG